jgi:DNA-binding response OmpR family regulator
MSAAKPARSILLVEDDRDYFTLLKQAFAEAGFQTLHAENGERAIRLLHERPVDLIVSDFIMPELNGLELCRLVNDDVDLSRIKVVLYSCNPDIAFRKKARELGALDYLVKTENAEDLVRQICELAGLEAGKTNESQSNGHTKYVDLLASLAVSAEQLRIVLQNLMDFIQIAGLSESPSPPVRLAWEAAQRNSGDIKRLLEEIEKGIGQLRTQAGGH